MILRGLNDLVIIGCSFAATTSLKQYIPILWPIGISAGFVIAYIYQLILSKYMDEIELKRQIYSLIDSFKTLFIKFYLFSLISTIYLFLTTYIDFQIDLSYFVCMFTFMFIYLFMTMSFVCCDGVRSQGRTIGNIFWSTISWSYIHGRVFGYFSNQSSESMRRWYLRIIIPISILMFIGIPVTYGLGLAHALTGSPSQKYCRKVKGVLVCVCFACSLDIVVAICGFVMSLFSVLWIPLGSILIKVENDNEREVRH